MLENWFDPEAIAIVLCGTLAATMLRCGLADSRIALVALRRLFGKKFDPAKAKVLSQRGEYAWGGAASTAFWVDPVEDLTVIFLTQLLPSSTHPIRPEMKALVYQALL